MVRQGTLRWLEPQALPHQAIQPYLSRNIWYKLLNVKVTRTILYHTSGSAAISTTQPVMSACACKYSGFATRPPVMNIVWMGSCPASSQASKICFVWYASDCKHTTYGSHNSKIMIYWGFSPEEWQDRAVQDHQPQRSVPVPSRCLSSSGRPGESCKNRT